MSENEKPKRQIWYKTVICEKCKGWRIVTPNNPVCIHCGHDNDHDKVSK